MGNLGLIPGLGRSPGEGVGTHSRILGLQDWASLQDSCSSAGKETACSAGDLGLIPGLGRSPGEGNSYPLQHCFHSAISNNQIG